MRQAEVVIRVVQRQLLAEARLVFTERDDTPSYRGHMLTNGEVDTFNEGGIDLPALRGQHRLDPGRRAKYDSVVYTDHASAPIPFDDLRVEQLRQGHPAELGGRPLRLSTFGLHPVAIVRQQCGRVLLE